MLKGVFGRYKANKKPEDNIEMSNEEEEKVELTPE